MAIKWIVDASSDLKPETAARVEVVPMAVRFGEKEYTPGVDLDSTRFYEMLVESDELPTTSQVTPQVFTDAFQNAVADGSSVICITLSSKLSGTYQSAVMAAEEFPGQVYVVDSRTVTIGEAILIEYGLELAAQGMEAPELVDRLLEERENIRLLALVDTLEYLKKGGRVSPAVAFAGGLLNIKPVIAVRNGVVEVIGKARGSRQGNNLLVQEIQKAGGVDFSKPVMLGYTGLSDALLKKYIADSAALWEGRADRLPISMVGAVIGTHAGPGAVAVAFFGAKQGNA